MARQEEPPQEQDWLHALDMQKNRGEDLALGPPQCLNITGFVTSPTGGWGTEPGIHFLSLPSDLVHRSTGLIPLIFQSQHSVCRQYRGRHIPYCQTSFHSAAADPMYQGLHDTVLTSHEVLRFPEGLCQEAGQFLNPCHAFHCPTGF